MKIAVDGNAEIEISVPHGTTTLTNVNSGQSKTNFIKTDYQEDLLAELMQTYAVSDFCLIGRST